METAAAHTQRARRGAAGFVPPASVPALVLYGLIGVLVGLALIAWLITDERMRGMDAGPGTDPGALGFYVGVWVVMMAAMMFPSIWPMVVMYARVQEGKRERGKATARGATTVFVGGYLLTWTLAGLAAYAILETGRSLEIDA